MSWDDQEWIRRGVQHWLEQGASLVFVTLTLEQPHPHSEVAEMWRQFKQALDRTVANRAEYLGGVPFVRVFERQEKRHQTTGESVVHLHCILGGLQYRGDRLSGRPERINHLKAEDLDLRGARITKEELQRLAVRYGFGPVLDITQIQANSEDTLGAYRVARYLSKYLTKFEEIAEWLPKGKQVLAGSRGKYAWAGPGVTRLQIRNERSQRALEFNQATKGGRETSGAEARAQPAAGPAGPGEAGAS
jgi:hypothetical protein